MQEIYKNWNLEDISQDDISLLSKGFEDFSKYSRALEDLKNEFKVTIFGSARTKESDLNYKIAKQMGKVVSEQGYKVITGAGAGIMQAGHEGAGKENAVGFNIHLPFEQSANHIIDGSVHLVTCNYFFTRKVMFVRESDAVIACPGGFGTMDELFEVITLMQTGKAKPMPLVLLEKEGGDYWTQFLNLAEFLVNYGTVSKEDLIMFKQTSSTQDALDYINDFYKVYHSCEFVGDKLIIRLKEKISEDLLLKIQNEFSDFIGNDGLKYSSPLENEIDLQSTESLPRLIMQANKTKPIRLYQMVMALNK